MFPMFQFSRKATADEELFLALSAVSAMAGKQVERALKPHGLTVAEYGLLRMVENRPGLTAADAAARLSLTRPAVAQMVKGLEAKKMLERERDAVDARLMHLSLTRAGQTAVRGARRSIEEFLGSLQLPSRLLQSLGGDLSTLLSSLSSHAQAHTRADA